MSTRVLIVEDNPVARGFLARVVRESFTDVIEIVEAASLASARLALAARMTAPEPTGASPATTQSGFRLILCALELVDGPGLELLEQVQHDSATRIATTLYSDDDHLFPALQLGVDGYLLKEDRFEVLVEELQRIVRGQPTMSPAIARRIANFFRQHASLAGDFDVVRRAPATLSARDLELLGHLAKGFTFKEIARTMGMRLHAINEQILTIYRKLATSSEGLIVTVGDDGDT
ncbi:MAG: response regulator transcription factor [Burkholderiales bacterium]|nr:response regulator transcription factor [Burkholderiales bacterium]